MKHLKSLNINEKLDAFAGPASSSKYSTIFKEKFYDYQDLMDWVGRLSQSERGWLKEIFSGKYVD